MTARPDAPARDADDRTRAGMAATALLVVAAGAAAIAAAPSPAVAGALVGASVLAVEVGVVVAGHLRATDTRVCLPHAGVCVGPTPDGAAG